MRAALPIIIMFVGSTLGCSQTRPRVIANPMGFQEHGLAAWYGGDLHGKLTASGERFDKTAMTTAHKSLPFNSLVEVTNAENGRAVQLRVNDRGPYHSGRVVDVSERAAELLNFKHAGVVRVRIRYLGRYMKLSGGIQMLKTYRPTDDFISSKKR